MEWVQVDVFTTTAGIEPVGAALLELNAGGYTVQDAADFEDFLQGKYSRWDYIDDDLLQLREAETTLTVYLPTDTQGTDQLTALADSLRRLRALDQDGAWGRLTYATQGLREEDWESSWKQYYKPMRIGRRLVICPIWESCDKKANDVVVRMDPGMAFGTGDHASTRLCLQLLDANPPAPADAVLDLGCGSGILSIAALLLGAKSVIGIDIDSVAVEIAQKNAVHNAVEAQSVFRRGNLAKGITGTFNLIFANIVADVILDLLPDIGDLLVADGAFIASGIIDTREQDILQGIAAAGLSVQQRVESGGWLAFRCKADSQHST